MFCKFAPKKRASKGFSLVELLVVVAIIGIISAIAVPALLAAKKSANESAAIGTLRALSGAEAINLSLKGKYDTLANLGTNGFIDTSWGTTAGKQRSGYTYAEATATSSTFSITATRTDTSASGSRDFKVDQGYTIFDNTVPATPVPIGQGQ